MIFGSMLIEKRILKDGCSKEKLFMKIDKSKGEVESQEWTAVPIWQPHDLLFTQNLSFKTYIIFYFPYLKHHIYSVELINHTKQSKSLILNLSFDSNKW